MRSETEMLNLIKEIGVKLNVKAIALNGSKANKNATTDSFQDFDVVYFVDDQQMRKLINHRNWLDDFGMRLIMQVPGDFEPDLITYQDFFTFLMLFTDDNRIDLGLCPVNKIEQWHKNDPVGKVIYDPDNLLPGDLLSDGSIYNKKRPTQLEFDNCSNEFWWVSTYIVKGIARGELLYATDHFYQNCFQEFLKMLSFKIAWEHDFKINLGKNHKNLCNYLTEEQQATIQNLLTINNLADLTNSLFSMQNWFKQSESEVASQNALEYDANASQKVINYTHKKLDY